MGEVEITLEKLHEAVIRIGRALVAAVGSGGVVDDVEALLKDLVGSTETATTGTAPEPAPADGGPAGGTSTPAEGGPSGGTATA